MRPVSNFSCATVQLAPSGEWVPIRGHWYILRVISGVAFWIGNDEPIDLSAGSVLLACGGRNFRLFANRENGALFRWMVVLPDSLSGILAADERLALEKLAESGFQGFRINPEDELAIRAGSLFSDQSLPRVLVRIRFLDIMLTVLVPQMKLQLSDTSEVDARSRLRSALSRLPESELMATNVDVLAASIGCSTRHFSRLFAQEVGVSFRERQTELRLMRARDLLSQSNAKIVDIAFQSGYHHLGLFNSLFRRRFGLTPSAWRRQSQKPTRARDRKATSRSQSSNLASGIVAIAMGVSLFAAQPETVRPSTVLTSTNPFPAIAASASSSSASLTNGLTSGSLPSSNLGKAVTTNLPPVRVIRDFTVEGNTLLSSETIDLVLSDYRGLPITTNNVTQAVKALSTVYQGRGFYTVAVSVPKQSITNGVIRLSVTEARLSEIVVKGNHWFSEGNVRRSLPDLHTNILLNSKIFQQELNQANNNQDRQIYPLIEPGSTARSTRLVLNVKDQIPIHGRFELNNQFTPGTPELRGSASVQYNNLWQREHAVGLQYGFTPQEFKAPETSSLMDRPLIANYSGYYRLPLSSVEPMQPAIDANPRKFGYNEATRQFVLPPSQGRTDLTIYANRSTTDTGVKTSPVETINPAPIGLYSKASGQDVSTTEAIGFRISKPLPEFLEIQSSLSFGADLKNFQRASFNTNDFLEQFSFLNPDTGETQTNSLPFSNTQPPRTANVSYLPVAVRWDSARSDTNGTTTFGAGLNFNFAGGPFSGRENFINTAGTTNATGTYVTLQASASRQQKLTADWTLLIKADGQWANEPLISNEQLGMGGTAGVRGYLEGERYGDTGWRFTLEPRTPMVDIGMVDGTMPLRIQGAFFMDYGRSYSLNPNTSVNLQTLWGTGMGLNAKVGSTFDFRVAVAWALRDAQLTHAGALQVYFAVAAQF